MEKLTTLPWQQNPAAQAVLLAFADAGVDIRFVGGCVRDALLNGATAKTDCDMATPATPDVVTALLQRAGLQVVPTGIDYGTVTAVHDCQHVEITTLRRDVETDGRHAVVRYGTSWEEDAARRDFTINALYADADGTLYDYTNGINDARAGRVRFIGIPAARIAEDYLRIMRFFRFTARFGSVPDAEGLAACTAARAGMAVLKRERVWMELAKILTLSKPLRAIQPMIDAGVLQEVLPEPYTPARLARLADYEHDNQVTPVPALRLAALCDAAPDALQAALKLSNRDASWLRLAAESLRAESLQALRVLWYRHDEMFVLYSWLGNLALLLLADDDVKGTEQWPTDLYALATAYSAPVFPLAGADVLALGIPAGPQVGVLLALVERWWIDNDFTPKREECLARLRASV